MSKINYMLYKHISSKYKSIPHFADITGLSQKELNAVLLKENIIYEVVYGVKICKLLDLDIDKLVKDGKIYEEKYNSQQDKDKFHDRYIRLSDTEKKKVIEFMIAKSESITPVL